MRVFSYGRDLVPLYKKEGDSAKKYVENLVLNIFYCTRLSHSWPIIFGNINLIRHL